MTVPPPLVESNASGLTRKGMPLDKVKRPNAFVVSGKGMASVGFKVKIRDVIPALLPSGQDPTHSQYPTRIP